MYVILKMNRQLYSDTEDYCYCVREEESEEEFLDWKKRLRWSCVDWGNQHEEMWFGDDEDSTEIVRQWIRELGGIRTGFGKSKAL